MSVYPFAYDSDETIIRIDDNITELGGDAINQLRDAIFAIEAEIGLDPSGSLTTIADRLDVFLNPNGTPKHSALAAVGLVTLPIVDNQVAANAGIKEYKLALDHTTSDLYTIITANKTLLDAINAFATITNTNFLNHLAGSTFLADGSSARHVVSHIDLNTVPSDPRDPFFTWTGLKDKNGNLRTATQAAEALLQINNDLVDHENTTQNAHIASAISVDVSNFQEIPVTANTVQKVIDYLERAEELNIGEHRATQHANGIPSIARSQSLTIDVDGYGRDMIVPATTVNTYLVNPPANTPVDSNTVGDDIIKFKPTNTDFIFDSYFSKVQVGDIVRVDYGNGVATAFEVESIRFTPGVEWLIRINGSNLANAVDNVIDGYMTGNAIARIDRPQYDANTAGVLALAAANSIPTTLSPNILGSLIVGHPRGATALGLGFDGTKLDTSHYKLWLQLYPTGNPVESAIILPFIDVTGDAGVSPGCYTLEKIVSATNDAFRRVGYNYRFIAFAYKGDFGLMLADPINKASFAIINGSNATGTVLTDIYTQNVIGDATDGDGLDVFGFGSGAAQLASPIYQATFVDIVAAQHPTQVITPTKRRFYIVNGQKLDEFAPTYLANDEGYWPAVISAKVSTGSSIEITYKVNLNLCAAKLKPGKTLVVQPMVGLTDTTYSINDYGRFIIKQVNFSQPCGTVGAFTTITVINGIHANGNAIAFTSEPSLAVKLYFSEDSVSFNDLNIIDGTVTGVNYHRYHEIYINKEGVVFSHERARMKADQAESAPPSSLLRSDYWHIKSVSSKLRGYRDSTTSFNKYVRFYVTSYDATSGEFSGYIGKRNPSDANIINPGPITTSRKNVTTRFYDETYVDYIDLEFKEIAIGPTGTAILSNANPRYVDIEVFPSFRDNPENMLLGSCEVNWHPSTNQNIIQSVKDLRDFGSIGITDFNTSAVEFLSASDRWLHENGVVRGFQYLPTGTVNDTGQLFFNGGVALVNGKIVTTNNSSVIIPTISDGGATGVIVTWAVCVNEFGYLIPIILTSTKDQIFAGLGSLYYVESVTFDELVNDRKDLTLIATVDAHISSITINDSDVHDLRRCIANEGMNHSLTLTQDQLIGNFHTFDAVKQWINRSNGNNNLVRIKGTWTITDSIDLNDFTNAVVFEGDGAIFNINVAKGVLLGNNVSLRNINFVYTPPTLTYTSGDLVNSGNGCIYNVTSISTNLQKISIEDCNFSSSLVGTQRPPFINFETNNNQIIDQLDIRNNTFTDASTTALQTAIAIISNNNAASTAPALLSNCNIDNNFCNRNQGIYISVPVVSGGVVRPGINVSNTEITKNKCGTIGYLCSSTPLASGTVSLGLTIKNNTCRYIESATSNGKNISVLSPPFAVGLFGFGQVIIDSNYCHWIQVTSQDGGASNPATEYASLIVKNNILTAYDYSGFLQNNFLGGNSTNNVGIIVNAYPTLAASNITDVQIINNNLNIGRYNSTTYKYMSGIYCNCSSIISGNIIKGFATSGLINILTDGKGIVAAGAVIGLAVRNYTVTHNKIYRGSDSINAYICGTTSSSFPSTGMVTNNFFDSTTIDGSSTVLLLNIPSIWRVDRNKNHSKTLKIRGFSGKVSLTPASLTSSDLIVGHHGLTLNSYVTCDVTASGTLVFNYTDTSSEIDFAWRIPLNSLLPEGVSIVSASLQITGTNAAATQRQATLTLSDASNTNGVILSPATATATALTVAETTDFAVNTYITEPGNATLLSLTFRANHSSGFVPTFGEISVVYRY